MENYKVVKYSAVNYNEWNDFLLTSKNATFLFHRNYMDYHNDRFEDFSLLVYHKNKLVSVFPANSIENKLYSHQGLTYGGIILPKAIKLENVLDIFKELLRFLNKKGIEELIIKELPAIYMDVFSFEINYLLFILKAELLKCDTLTIIDLNNKLKPSKGRLEGYKRARKHHLIIKEEENLDAFWNEILTKNLKKKHNVKPVHSLDEIMLLKSRFPKNIRQFNVYNENKIVAGTTIFETKHVAHSQYISGNEDNNTLGSLDFLHLHLIENVFKNKKYFDFGTSNENNGLNINKGLLFWKEGFGARTLTQNFYKVETQNFNLLNSVFV